jgi:alanine racemase
MSRAARAIIDLEALRSNYALACRRAPGSRTLAVVKANAYGHGAVECARALEAQAPAFAVCCLAEALELRDSGIRKPILLLRGDLTPDAVRTAAEQRFWLLLYEPAHLDMICSAELPAPVRAWLKVDTGMHRLGLEPGALAAAHARLQASDNVEGPVVVATHFACADDPGSDFTKRQIGQFHAAVEGLDAPASLANSAGILAWPAAHADWNRPGIMLYGSSPMREPGPHDAGLRPVMHLVSEVIALRHIGVGESVGYTRNWRATRPSAIATAAIGYADGYPRHAPNGTPVLVNGQRVPLVGRVSMDMITVDVTDLEPVRLGDPVTLWGPQLPVNEVATAAGTIGYELLTRMTGRAPREYR